MKSRDINLGIWNIYFIVKIILFFNHIIEFNIIRNLAFIVLLLIPIRNKILLGVRQVIAIPIGLYLLYDDSYLPPFSRLVAQTKELSTFKSAYLFELITRFVSTDFLLILFITTALYFMLFKILRISILVIIAVFLLSFKQFPTDFSTNKKSAAQVNEVAESNSTKPVLNELTTYKNDFFNSQAELSISFDPVLANSKDFDILILSVCSLSWEDVKHYNQENHKLFQEFDILFDSFNSATSYSGPSVIRLLQANCGQKSEMDIMSHPSNKQCYLLNNLKSLGYDMEFILNHDGTFDNFADTIQTQGHMESPPKHYNLKPYLYNFDDTYIHRDKDVFSEWLKSKDINSDTKKVTLYNTVSLHDGVFFINNKSLKSIDSYEQRLITLLDDMYNVITELKRLNRPTLVLFVPEHGGNMTGDKTQIPGMRELPSPTITNVPVGVKIIGNNIHREGTQKHITQPSSFLAITSIINKILKQNVFAGNTFTPDNLTDNLPETPLVSENEGSIVIKYKGDYFYSFDMKEWSNYNQ